MPIIFPLFLWSEKSYRPNLPAILVLITNMISVYFAATLTAQLVVDHDLRFTAYRAFYPWLAGILLFMMFLESSIEKRHRVIQEASRYTEHPQYSHQIRYWKATWLAVVPIFTLCLQLPQANLPYIYGWCGYALDWLFGIRYLGGFIALIAAYLCVKAIVGGLVYAWLRGYEAIARVPGEYRVR